MEANGFQVHTSYNADTLNKASTAPSTIPQSQDAIISIIFQLQTFGLSR